MRNAKIAVLAVSICALGMASVRAVESFTAYNLGINYTNSTAQYWSVNGGPSTTGTSFLGIVPTSYTSVQTDGAGRITGSGELLVTYSPSGLPYSVFYVDYAGKVSSGLTVPLTVTMTIKGNGYTVDGSGQATTINNNISLKFTGAPGVNPFNKNQTKVLGTLTGRISGTTPLGNNQVIPAVQAVFTGGTSTASFVRLSPDVLQTTRRMEIFDAPYGGAGSVTSTTYKFAGHGYGTARGVSLAVNGFLGSYTNSVGTNAIGFTAPVSADLKGKVQGQVVSGSATPTQINPTLLQ